MPGRVQARPDPREALPNIFEQAQHTTANHKKNCVALHKLHVQCANSSAATDATPTSSSKRKPRKQKNDDDDEELAFVETFLDALNRVLAVKKGAVVAERLVKFIAAYVKTLIEKASENEDEDAISSRFVERVIRHLLRGFLAKDKYVRYRAVQFIAEILSDVGSINEDLLAELKDALLERIHDKESTVRAQAAVALAKIASDEEDKGTVDTLLEALQYDPSPDVRKAVLLSIPPQAPTLPALLTRTRDTDTATRKLLYIVLLSHLEDPRQLSIAQRERIIQHGLHDREAAVSAAAAKLVGSWLDYVGGDCVAFLGLVDVFEDEESSTGKRVAEDALKCVFEERVDVLDNLTFDDAYWTSLTPEKAFLARVFVDFCVGKKDEARLEAAIPVVTALAFNLQARYNALLDANHAAAEADEAAFLAGNEDEDAKTLREQYREDMEFVIGEMMKLAVNLDYGDEIGRRKMFQLVRHMVSQSSLPDSLVHGCLDILRKLSAGERDLIRVVVEVVHELRDPDEVGDESRVSGASDAIEGTPMTLRSPSSPTPTPGLGDAARLPKPLTEMSPEEKARADAIDMRCLDLCIGMLERVNGTFEENSTLEGILGELIVPSVKRKEPVLREKGLICLGLCCLIARRMALNSFSLFLGQLQISPEFLKVRVLHVVFDILMVHDRDLLGKAGSPGERVMDFLLHLLQTEDSAKVRAVLCIGIAKLMLSDMVFSEDILKTLVLTFLSPETTDNQELRQCLSYFFPVYCYSSPTNQRRVSKIFMPVYLRVAETHRNLDDTDEMVGPSQVSQLLADWTDPQKAVDIQGRPTDQTIHLDLIHDILKGLFAKDLNREEKKYLCQLLGKLYLPDEADDDKVKWIKLLLNNVVTRRPPRDTTARNALSRFDKVFTKKYAEQLETFNQDELRALEEWKEHFDDLDELMGPEEDDDVEDSPPARKRGHKRRSHSVTSNSTAESWGENSERATPAPRSSRGKGKAKRRRLSNSDDESDVQSGATSPETTPPAEAPTRSMPRRAAAPRKSLVEARVDSDEGGDEEDEDHLRTPMPKRRAQAAPRHTRERDEVAEAMARIDAKLDAEESFDSIMDSDGSEDEVDGLL